VHVLGNAVWEDEVAVVGVRSLPADLAALPSKHPEVSIDFLSVLEMQLLHPGNPELSVRLVVYVPDKCHKWEV
jgi:hypothetical protein